ncbi:YybH family protein [Sphaerotilus sp.]|uniref:YybH family protein n=1 Tax=Sphaerotilus sp. TaxID=2093942 RepID=UPI002ACE3209|nr:nuclear transport factor 2 family protein [Sphaerotilus sp.]MDZ7857945.1 nuclear transport factor 2 family protein [Sphaerotilus sp.]
MPRVKPLQASLMATPDETEAQFYEALQHADLDRVMSVWSDDEDIACIHPGGPRLVGAQAIRSAFESLFANGSVDARISQVRRIVAGGFAVHHVLEEIRMATPEGPQRAYVLATNIFVKTPQGWRLLAHHASPGSPRQVQEFSDEPSTLH